MICLISSNNQSLSFFIIYYLDLLINMSEWKELEMDNLVILINNSILYTLW